MKVSLLEEHEDGSATYTFDMTDAERDQIIEIGILSGIKKGMEMDGVLKQHVELLPEQIDSIVIQEMKRMYRYAINHGLPHPEDIEYYEGLALAVELILKHFMIRVEAEEWIAQVRGEA